MSASTRPERGEALSAGGEPAAQRESQAAARVLLIEDEPGIVDFVQRGLEAEGFAVQAALDGIEGERLALERRLRRGRARPDAPRPLRSGDPRGACACASLTLPVIVLTARGEIEDRVAGLEAGAVDYLVKPFSIAELVARVRAQLRVVAQASASTLRAEDIEVDLLTRKVQPRGSRRRRSRRPSSSCSST